MGQGWHCTVRIRCGLFRFDRETKQKLKQWATRQLDQGKETISPAVRSQLPKAKANPISGPRLWGQCSVLVGDGNDEFRLRELP
jgi:hypothetical protein